MTNAVTENELLALMNEGRCYRKSQVAELMPDRPRPAVTDALDSLVRKGLVWRTRAADRFEFIRLAPADLENMTRRRADRSEAPSWMKKVLTGYESALFLRASLVEPTSYRA